VSGRARAAPGEGLVTLALGGDVMTGRGIDQVLPHPSDPRLCEPYVQSALDYVGLAERAHGPIARPVGLADIWGDALEALEHARPDARIINLETSVTTSEDCAPKGINYRMHPANAGCLTAAAIDCCTLANNHVLDWGPAGLVETLTTLHAAGLKSAGAGLSPDEAARPAVIDVADKGRVLVFACAAPDSGVPADWAAAAGRPGINVLADLSPASAKKVADAARAARRPGDVVVVSLHWGGNWGYEVPGEQRAFAHRLIEAGAADVVHGHSAHHAKAIEVYRERLVLYGCGDLLNDYEGIGGYEQYRDDLALLYFPRVAAGTGALAGLRMTPFRIRRLRLERASREDAAWLAATLDRESRRFGAHVTLEPDDTLRLAWG
jgi:poly-gamma-glutamate capsule biosynthesis protein CapA/YwtB (metallophosphatase superfamily)